MDRRTVLAVVLSVGIYYAWLAYRGPLPGAEEGVEGGPAGAEQVEAPAPVASPAPAPVVAAHPVRDVAFQGCEAVGSWTTEGGVLRDLTLAQYQEPYHVDPIWSWLGGFVMGGSEFPWRPYGGEPGSARLLSPDALALATGSGDLSNAPPRMEVVQETADTVVFRGLTAEGLQVEQRVALVPAGEEPCQLNVQVTWSNPTGSAYSGPLWVGVHDHMPEAATGMTARYRSIERPVLMADGDVVHGEPEDIAEEAIAQEGEVSWFGVSDRYFGFIVLPRDHTGTVWLSERATATGPLYGEHYVLPSGSLAPGASYASSFDVYVGPLDVDVLERVDADLPDIVDYGWFAFFAHPLLWFLEVLFAGVKSWGLAIILLTVTVKTIFFPLTQSAFKSSQAMQAIQPRLQALRETHKDSPDELNRRTMELFREAKVNPLGGCLPMLVQFPVWVALYNVLLSSVELYHTEFLWLKDLSSADPTGVLPAVVVVLMVIQQNMTPMGNLDPVQARVMKIMPIVFGIFFFAFPSGLVVYIFVNMLLSILQQWLIKRTFQLPPTAAAS